MRVLDGGMRRRYFHVDARVLTGSYRDCGSYQHKAAGCFRSVIVHANGEG